MAMARDVARWESRGKCFLQLSESNGWYSYTGHKCGGSLPLSIKTDIDAVAHMESPWGHPHGTGMVTVAREDNKSLRRVK